MIVTAGDKLEKKEFTLLDLKQALSKLTIMSAKKNIVLVTNLDDEFLKEKEVDAVIRMFQIKIEEPTEDMLKYLKEQVNTKT